MPVLRFYQLDVFTSEPLAGNALAVFPDAEGIPSDQMQRLAREMNVSETTFVLPSDCATRRIRIFTPTAELPLAGHPTIGTWWLLAELRAIELPDTGVLRITQETGAGVLPVDIRVENGRLREVVMVQMQPQFIATFDDRGRLAHALGGAENLIDDSPPPQVVSTALPQLMIPIRSAEALRTLPVGGSGAELTATLREVETDCAMCYWLDPDAERLTARCRMFAPGLGVPEDPATGSAAGALGAYLQHHGLMQADNGSAHLTVHQGEEIARPSRIQVEVDVTPHGEIREVRVGGEAVTVIEGEVRL